MASNRKAVKAAQAAVVERDGLKVGQRVRIVRGDYGNATGVLVRFPTRGSVEVAEVGGGRGVTLHLPAEDVAAVASALSDR